MAGRWGLRDRNDFWTCDEDRRLRKEYSHDLSWSDLAKLFPGRTQAGVRHRASKLKLSAGRTQGAVRVIAEARPEPSEQIWLDRDRRSNEPRDITALLCGDPPFSQSALARNAGARGQPKAEKAYEVGLTYLDPASAV